MKWLSVILAVGAAHLYLLSLVTTSSVRIQARTSITQQPQHERKMGNLPLVLSSWERSDRMKNKMEVESRDDKDKVYDFIVVGAGTAGSIVAARLSEQFSVLMLEAGGQPHMNHDNSAMSMVMAKHPETDWMYPSSAQNETCLLCPDKRYIFSAGKGLGGSANLNYLGTLSEGTFSDYNEWMEATQDPGWGLFMLQPYFKTVKDYMKKKYPISTGESPYYRSPFKALIKTTPKLEIQKYSHVHKIIIDDNGRATGVKYDRHGSIRYANASREVIVSAGAFGSPKLLMISGIGPKATLNRYNITQKVNLESVGKNFQDHLAIPLGPFFKSLEQNTTISAIHDGTWNSTTILRMPLVNLNYNAYSKELSHFLSIPENILTKYMLASSQKHKNVSSSGGGGGSSTNSMFINVALKKPLSKGEVSITGRDPQLKPIVNPNFLSEMNHDSDLAYSSEKQLLIDGLEETVRLMEDNPTFKAKFTQVPFPGCESYIFRGYGYWDCYIRHFSISLNHGIGTCAMGSSSPAIPAVVNPKLKVYGVKGLRVIDASVMPTLVGTFPYQSVAVIAEKGADMIIKQYILSQDTNPDPELETADQNHLNLNIDRDDNNNNRGFEFFSGFRIKKVPVPELTSSTATTIKPVTESMSDFWKKTDQIIQQAYSHTLGSSLSEFDLTPPGDEKSSGKLNPSHFPVRPFAQLIFHPLVPQQSPLAQSDFQKNGNKAESFSLSALFSNLFSFSPLKKQPEPISFNITI